MAVARITHHTRSRPVVTGLQYVTTPQKLIANTGDNWSLQLRVLEHSRRQDEKGFGVRQNKRSGRGIAADL